MSVITVSSDGPWITASDYWTSEYAAAGKLYASVNAGCVRLLLPPSARSLITEIRGSAYAILSRGPWPAERLPEAVEIMWEDGTPDPYSVHLSPDSFGGALPAEPPPGQEWEIMVYDCRRGRPHMASRRRLYWRRATRLPWLKPLTDPRAT